MSPASYRPSRALAVFLIFAGVVGWVSAFALTLDKFALLEDPDAALGCNFSRFIQCGANLNSWQGALFFDVPNPLWGLGGFVAPIAVGVAVLAGAQFARWFWIAFNVGVAGAMAFVIWLIWQSIYFIGTLCPWCMLVWSVTIPMFLAVTLHSFKSGAIPIGDRGRRVASAMAFVIWLIWQSIYFIGTLCPWCMLVWSVTIPMFLAVTLHSFKSGAIPIGDRGRRVASAIYGWVPAITIGAFLLIAVLAQLRIDVLQEFR